MPCARHKSQIAICRDCAAAARLKRAKAKPPRRPPAGISQKLWRWAQMKAKERGTSVRAQIALWRTE